MIKSSFVGIITGASSFAYSCYLLYNSPRFLKMNDLELDQEIELTALYLSTKHDITDINDEMAECVIRKWRKQKWALNQRDSTLSQIAIIKGDNND
jgi:hypothetical protein